MVRQLSAEGFLKQQERQIRRVGDYTGSIEPPKFDISKPTPYPYGKFRRGVAREGWKPATKPQWRAWFENHRRDTYLPLIKHTLRAHFAEGVDYKTGVDGARNPLYTVEGAIDAFFKRKLVIAPWNLDWASRPFWGMMDSEAKAKARRFGALKDDAKRRYEVGVKRRASLKAGEDKSRKPRKHQDSYGDYLAERADTLARERGEPEPKEIERRKKLRKWEGPKKLEKCPDCLQECFLVNFEHAKGGSPSYDGKLRCSCCPRDNRVARADYDASNHAVFLATRHDMTAADHAALVEVDVAFARPHEASDAALERRAWARRAAVSARDPKRERIMNSPTPQRRRRDVDRFEAGPDETHWRFGKKSHSTKSAKRKAPPHSAAKPAKPSKRVARARKVRTPVAGTGK